MTREEAIAKFEKQLTSAMVVLDSGFGTRPGESDRVYRERKEMAEIALSALRAQQEVESKLRVFESNEPLTLDELRKMDRMPVYIWYPYPKYGEWVISDGFNQYKNFTSTDNNSWYSGDYGKTWIAYRHKPEEVDHA